MPCEMTICESAVEIIEENSEDLNRYDFQVIEIIVKEGEAKYLSFKPQKIKKK